MHHPVTLALVGVTPLAEHHRAEAELADDDAGAAERAVSHSSSLTGQSGDPAPRLLGGAGSQSLLGLFTYRARSASCRCRARRRASCPDRRERRDLVRVVEAGELAVLQDFLILGLPFGEGLHAVAADLGVGHVLRLEVPRRQLAAVRECGPLVARPRPDATPTSRTGPCGRGRSRAPSDPPA